MTFPPVLKRSATKRTGIPLLLLCALLFWLIGAIVYTISYDLETGRMIYVAFGTGAVSLVCLICFIKFKNIPFLFSMFLCLGVLVALYGSYGIKVSTEAFDGYSGEMTFTLKSDVSQTEYGSSAYAGGRSPDGKNADFLLYLPDGCELLNGETFTCECGIDRVKESSARMYWERGVCLRASVKSYEVIDAGIIYDRILGARRYAIEAFNEYAGESAGILQALVCGYRNTINDSGQYEKYKICGLAHIVAVSGAHLAIVLMILGVFLKALHIPRKPKAFISVVFLISYLIFSRIPISAIRAALMAVLSLTSFIAKRRSMSLNSLALCVIAFIVSDPCASVSVSLFLSSASTLGIILFSRLISSWFGDVSKAVENLVVSPLSLTLSSSIATLPYSAALFSQLSLIAPLANIIATPLFCFACVSGLSLVMISYVLSPFIDVSALLIGMASLSAQPLSFAIDVLSSIPFSCIAVSLCVPAMIALSVFLCVLLWKLWPDFSKWMVAGALGIACAVVSIAIFTSSMFGGDRICMLDVGQGDSFLIQSDGATILIDTGNRDSKLREAIAEHGIYHLDAVIITHPDEDHCASLVSLDGYVDIDRVYVAKDLIECGCKNCTRLKTNAAQADLELCGLSLGDRITVGKFNLEVVWPVSYEDEGGNSDSVCLLTDIDCDSDGSTDYKAFFCGDAESEQLERIIDMDLLGDVDFYKVGHHGSRVAITDSIADVIKPEYSLISVGADNRYGHPTSDALDVLDRCGSEVFRTDEDGCVDIRFFASGFDIKCEKQT